MDTDLGTVNLRLITYIKQKTVTGHPSLLRCSLQRKFLLYRTCLFEDKSKGVKFWVFKRWDLSSESSFFN